jgi:hypothetical protein
MYRSEQNDYINPADAEINYFVKHPNPGINHRYTYKYCEVPTFGVGEAGIPIINCDSYFDTSKLAEIKQEFNENISKAKSFLRPMIPFGLVPTDINNQKCLDSYLVNLDKYDPEGDYIKYSMDIHHYHMFKCFMTNRFNLNRPWKNVIHFRRLKGFFQKNNETEWNESIEFFPKLRALTESLPFKTLGYVMIMRSQEDSQLDIHRDIFPRNHNCHHINIALEPDLKPFFIYDPITREKHYKTKDSHSYFFNECDMHGTDYEFNETLTMRVDGVFEDWFAEEIGLTNGVTFDWAYDKPQDFVKANGGIKIYHDTDI